MQNIVEKFFNDIDLFQRYHAMGRRAEYNQVEIGMERWPLGFGSSSAVPQQWFVRTSRSARLTRADKLFLEHVPRVLAALQQARDPYSLK